MDLGGRLELRGEPASPTICLAKQVKRMQPDGTRGSVPFRCLDLGRRIADHVQTSL